jgi:hypothetical protein
MATTTTNFGWDIPQSTDLVKDGATAIAALGQDIDTAMVDLKGGTTGQVLAKASGTDLDFSWVAADDTNAIQNAIVDAKGDLITATAADTPARLGVGTNGQILTADSTAATGIKWAAPAAAGKLLQVVNVAKTNSFTSTSTSYVDITGLTASITPTSATSTILVTVTLPMLTVGDSNAAFINLLRGSTAITSSSDGGTADTNDAWTSFGGWTGGDAGRMFKSASITYLDSPATTSSTTYKCQLIMTGGTGYVNRWFNTDLASVATITLMEISA